MLQVLGISAVFLCLAPLIPGQEVTAGFRVGGSAALLSLCVLFPVALKVTTCGRLLPNPGTPFVILNFIYFVAASLMPLIDPTAYYGSISFAAIVESLLVLSLGFVFFDVGVVAAGGVSRGRRSAAVIVGRISGLGAVTCVASVALWAMRLLLATKGFGITHVPTVVANNSSVGQLSVVEESVAYVPLALCLSRLCGPALRPEEARRWRGLLLAILVTDLAYYLLAGSRLGLLWEVIVPAWVLWSRRARLLPPGLKPIIACVLLGIMPLIYSQRAALDLVHPRLGESHLDLTRQYLPAAEDSLFGGRFVSTVSAGLAADAGRLSAIGPFSGVVDRILNRSCPLMRGETLAAEAPLLIPRLIWPAKPIGEKIDFIINRHFGLSSVDELSTCEMELFANFGLVGLCLGLLAFGFITQKLCNPLSAGSGASEPCLFFILAAMPLVFRVETDIMSIFAGLRLLGPCWAGLRLLERRLPLRCES